MMLVRVGEMRHTGAGGSPMQTPAKVRQKRTKTAFIFFKFSSARKYLLRVFG